MLRIARTLTYALLAGGLLAQHAGAADLYLSGKLSNSGATGTASGETAFFDVEGEDSDASPTYGGTLGLAFAVEEAFPQVQVWELPAWTLRSELEFLIGRDYELRSDGANSDDFFTEVDAWTLMPALWVEIPVRTPVSWLFGRVPILEPMSLQLGGGIGVASVDLDVTDNVSAGSESGLNFAWQAGAGIAYQLTDTTSLTFGWRYVSLGETEADLMFGPGAKAGDYALDLTSHEFSTGLRVNFYTSPLADMNPRHWRMPRMSLPGWLGGEGEPEEASDDDAL